MTTLNRKPRQSAAGKIAFGVAVATVGLIVLAMSYARIEHRQQVLAQATQPAAPDSTKSPPVEPVRPTTPAPQPARPDADAQKAGAEPALPPAPAEKTGEPIPERK